VAGVTTREGCFVLSWPYLNTVASLQTMPGSYAVCRFQTLGDVRIY